LLSVVTINLNNSIGLSSTLSSIFVENKKYFELVVIDGDSNDRSKEILKQKSLFIDVLISEKDSGIYNAMNKGIDLSSGDRLLFLNSGDVINNWFNFNKFISEYQETDIVYSNICKVLLDENKSIESRFPELLSLDYMICYGLPHQSTIIKKSLFNRVGFYDENYSIISDWVFFMEALFFHNATYKYVDITSINFDGYGISNQTKYLNKIILEQLDYITKRFPSKVELYKSHSPYVKKYFRSIPRWKKYVLKILFMKFNII
jgi:glycosyltransferase involved in cell wall biosynthesis